MQLQNIQIPVPNRALAIMLLSNDCRNVVEDVAKDALRLFRAFAPERTGEMAATAYATAEVTPLGFGKFDRWVGIVRVPVEYSVWNQTGAYLQGIGRTPHPQTTNIRPWFGGFEGDYTFTEVVHAMEVL